MDRETITITMDEYRRLQDSDHWLECLNAAGVDNWSGIDYARDIYNAEGGYDDED